MLLLFCVLVAAMHSGCWGAYKDSPYEGFRVSKFLRSVLLAAPITVFFWLVPAFRPEVRTASSLGLIVAYATTFERGATELYKGFIRNEKHSKYAAPSAFCVVGQPVAGIQRVALGALLMFAGLVFVAAPSEVHFGMPNGLALAALWGGLGGLAIAIGGAWKDTPIEGFKPATFLRSPFVAMMLAVILSRISNNLQLTTVAAMGAERMAVELWKTFITEKLPSKFNSQTIAERHTVPYRDFLLMPYFVTWTILAFLLPASFTGPIVAAVVVGLSSIPARRMRRRFALAGGSLRVSVGHSFGRFSARLIN